ncbi:excinuclease ABC C subunit domain-containing protein [Mesoflavibacter sp. HG96]|uniref:GIY-YIG nuclease family protein n=1 Tax=Winogradskyella marincola TaxID=3037795 RepID=A0ABT6G0W3_9FLAO|nr:MULTISPECIES: GIY-YIG nuclease family protein [Flavobacteriaceae]MDG4715676.1 GIY-YIG nuclease family protein [Winogradskyella sp. YYF002]QIJ90290.1 excinuclease ABC C subunit domain-containing protein [Mesoflavibacter sp. HG96]QIJ93018.1 excinuclease ABC C subunit domain-containing protein [Mesoflavibacter sp. HG37]
MEKLKTYYTYILSNKNRTVLYVGYTENIKTRLIQHKNGKGSVFTKKYNVFDLIHLETFEKKKEAKQREKQLKNWHKEWKWNLVKENNPELKTLKI